MCCVFLCVRCIINILSDSLTVISQPSLSLSHSLRCEHEASCRPLGTQSSLSLSLSRQQHQRLIGAHTNKTQLHIDIIALRGTGLPLLAPEITVCTARCCETVRALGSLGVYRPASVKRPMLLMLPEYFSLFRRHFSKLLVNTALCHCLAHLYTSTTACALAAGEQKALRNAGERNCSRATADRLQCLARKAVSDAARPQTHAREM